MKLRREVTRNPLNLQILRNFLVLNSALFAALRARQHLRQISTSLLVEYSNKSTVNMAHLSNPLATTEQLFKNVSNNPLPIELLDSIRFYTARLTQAAGILLRLPQDITAQANVLLFRYWLVDDVMCHEFSVCLLFRDS